MPVQQPQVPAQNFAPAQPQPQPAEPARRGFFGSFQSNSQSQTPNNRANDYNAINPSQFEEEEDDNYDNSSNDDDYMVPPFLRNRK